jgi:EAL domain-containing protein (putative c-di-GMP-specific phosphodiesterase class I)
MIDAQGDELHAQEFMPAAARNRLLRAIDRWVIGATLAFCSKTPLDRVFVKLSAESLIDKTLLEWLTKAVASSGVSPAQLCFQVREDDATQYLVQTQALAEKLVANGHGFAIEHFGVGRDSGRILAQMPMHYLKIDGSLMQSLASDPALQERVKVYVAAATSRGIQTIAERVENATTMAVLFQLGVAYMQGHYVHEPEVVLSEAATPR